MTPADVTLYGMPITVTRLVQTERIEEDGTVTPILCAKVDFKKGRAPRILVHPDRWEVFRAMFPLERNER